jgi:hypothetical protein
MISIITLPTDFISGITANAGTLFTDLAPVTTLIVGVLLGVLVISFIIHAIKSR